MKATGLNPHLSRVYSATKAGLAFIGLIAICALMLLPVERYLAFTSIPGLAGQMLTEASVMAARPVAPRVAEAALEQEQHALAEFIARRWRIAETAASSFVSIAYRAGKQQLFGFLVGQVMRRTAGRADARLVNEELRRRLDS